ncbi:AAA family ATPase [Brevibacillus sp. 1238]|uniref:ATP-binding protein n=1 Tax=Brevibacillus sp. 1238 TaxID=2940565 RepID=UPI0024769FFB|nr:AAA family ATPase [Brevibacillus sp. 1238]MDH6350497.1 DNA repair exonuclease SbcCD ATPase subunit [Brevibacillus sp. 1238]
MRIEELTVTGFGKWQGAAFRFAPGLNLFYAPNEAGKSTLLQAIFAALYGMKRDYVKTARYLPEYEKYRPWHQGEYETIITYQLGGKTYRLHRTLLKEREQARLFLDPEWTELTDIYLEDRRKERNFLEKHLGLTRSLFTDLTWIRREPLEAAEHLLPSFADVQEASPLVHTILAELDRDLTSIGKKERAENTQMGKAASRVARKEQELADAEAAWRMITQLAQSIRGWEEERQGLEQRRIRLQARMQKWQEQEQLLQERWQRSFTAVDRQEWDWWEQSAGSEEERQLHHQARKEVEKWGEPRTAAAPEAMPDQALNELAADYERGVALRKQREQRHLRLAELAVLALSTGTRSRGQGQGQGRAQRQGNQAKRRKGVLRLWGVAGVFASLGAVGLATEHPVLGGSAIGLALLLAALGVVVLRAKGGANSSSPAAAIDSQQALEGEQLQQEIAALDAELAKLVGRYGVSDWDTFLAKREELQRSVQEQRTVALENDLAKTRREELLAESWGEALRAILKREKRQCEEAGSDCLAQLAHIEAELQELREKTARAHGEMNAHESESVASARDEYEQAVQGLRQLQQRRDALQLARDTLLEAQGEWKRDVTPDVNRIASEVMSQITAGAYCDVRLDPGEGFAVRLLEPSRKQIVSQEQCSTGTADQLYLAQRLALLHHVSKRTEPLPLFLDDHFVHYDDERLRRTLAYVAELAAEQQVFLFTCHERERRMLESLLSGGARHKVHRIG